MFPRQNSGVDAIDGFTKIEAIGQTNIAGKDVYVEYIRGETFTEPLGDWGYRFGASDSLPAGRVYRKWVAKIVIENVQYQLNFALPEDGAKYFAPWEINSFVTEFFDQPGFFQVYFWDLEIQKEGSLTWEPIKKWRMGYKSDSVENIGYGVKVSQYNNKSVIEISNDGTDTYLKLGGILELPPSQISQPICSSGGPIRACIDSISPNPAKVGEKVIFKGHGTSSDATKNITRYQWKLDSKKSPLIEANKRNFSTTTIPIGTHSVYFRVGTKKLPESKTEWSNWVSKDLIIEDSPVQ